MKKKLLTIAMITTLLMTMLSTVSADVGPKPSIHITFREMEEGEVFYGTLLSKTDSTGPESAYERVGNKSMTQDGRLVEWEEGEPIWEAFQNYSDADGYYFLQCWWSCSESGKLDWTYRPPDTFKLLLYFPESGAFRVSPSRERYAFDSYYDVDVSGDGPLTLERNYISSWEFVSLLLRIALTVVIELMVAWAFGYREKRQLAFFMVVNVVTQIGLNVALNVIAFQLGGMILLLAYLPLELVVCVAEGGTYAGLLPRFSTQPSSRGRAVIYALMANALSFAVGIWLSIHIPYMF